MPARPFEVPRHYTVSPCGATITAFLHAKYFREVTGRVAASRERSTRSRSARGAKTLLPRNKKSDGRSTTDLVTAYSTRTSAGRLRERHHHGGFRFSRVPPFMHGDRGSQLPRETVQSIGCRISCERTAIRSSNFSVTPD